MLITGYRKSIPWKITEGNGRLHMYLTQVKTISQDLEEGPMFISSLFEQNKTCSGWGTHVNLWRIHFDIWQI